MNMNLTELNAILYYADMLSLQETSIPVTDTCKYFFIHGVPMNSCYIAGVEPFYDPENQYFKQSLKEYQMIKSQFGNDGIESFIDDMCNLKACGCVSGERMLDCIHYYSPKKKHKEALQKYNNWKDSITYKHIIKDEDGRSIIANCSKEIAHIEKTYGLPVESSILESSKLSLEEPEETTKIDE